MARHLCIDGASPAFVDALQALVYAHSAELRKAEAETASQKSAKKQQPDGEVVNIADAPVFERQAPLPLTDYQQQLISVFHALDVDGSETLTAKELRRALAIIGVPTARVGRIVRQADQNRSGEIELSEWKAVIVRSDFRVSESVTLPDDLYARLKSQDTMQAGKEATTNESFMVSPQSSTRIMWNFFILCSCAFVAIEFPFVLAWEDDISKETNNTLNVVEIAIDITFLLDIIFNFFTGFYNDQGQLVLDRASVAKNYMKTWFLLDLLSSSSMPLDLVEPGLNVQMLKVLKFWKVLRIFRMLKFIQKGVLSSIFAYFSLTQIAELIQRRSGVAVYMLLACHWLSCGMKLVDKGFLVGFEQVRGKLWQEYIAALYWSMTTLTTVGYGDITPVSDGEIIYVVFAMVIGGFFYGYVVGTIASMVASADLNASAYYDRMEIIHAWLAAHHSLPSELKARLRSYFKDVMEEKSAANEKDIWIDLTQELRKEVGNYIVSDIVKANPLFDRLGIGVIVQLQSVLRHVTMYPGQRVTTEGDIGTAMFMLDSGEVRWDRSCDNCHGLMGPGESFGEEILLGFKEDYEYTVTVTERVKIEEIEESDFFEVFSCMPKVLDRMRLNALELNPEWKETKPTLGMSLQHTTTTMIEEAKVSCDTNDNNVMSSEVVHQSVDSKIQQTVML